MSAARAGLRLPPIAAVPAAVSTARAGLRLPPAPALQTLQAGKPEGVLLQKILSCDRLSISCLCVDLALSGLDCARPPLTLMSVHGKRRPAFLDAAW